MEMEGCSTLHWGMSPSDFDVFELFEIMKRGIKWAAESLEKGAEKWLSPPMIETTDVHLSF